MAILVGIFLLAALPLVLVFIFFEVMAKKDNPAWSDNLQKTAVAMAWILLGLLALLVLYSASMGQTRNLHAVWRMIAAGLEFLVGL